MKVTVYSQPDCKGCEQVKLLLKANDVKHEVKDISVDETARELLLGKGYLSTPVTFVEVEEGSHEVVGFNIGQLVELLDL